MLIFLNPPNNSICITFEPIGLFSNGTGGFVGENWNLTPEQQQNLSQYLAKFPILQALYQTKQKLNSFLLLKKVPAKKAKKYIPEFLRLLDQFEESPAKIIAQTIRSWLEPIIQMWRFSKSNGITEGFHTKMEMISRRAFGFRNFQNYRLRVLALCGWNGVINRV